MKVIDLINDLKKCDPNGRISLLVNADMIDNKPEHDDGVEYGFDPVITKGFSNKECKGKPNIVHIEIPKE